jgi:hypothetical protein
MDTIEELKNLIEKATEIAGSQRKLAAMLDMEHANLSKIKKGERPANWRIRGGLRAILGEDPAAAFMAAMAEDLEQSEKTDEKKAAEGFRAILAAFPETKKAPSDNTQGLNSWRKRMNPPSRNYNTVLELAAFSVLSRLRDTIDRALNSRDRDTIFKGKTRVSAVTAKVLSYSF